ncbi:MAG: ATP synthase F1 subunit epsilon [Saprospiraceae bacterium]|nr:ATP synthase F1 subunit epsilon [Saprospiraceae bacterium]
MVISVLSPEKEIFTGEIISVKVPGSAGQFEVLQNHAPIVAALDEGAVRIKKANGEILNFNIRKGFIEVLYNEVSLLVQVSSEE